MFHNARGDTLISIIVAITILSGLLLSISIFLVQSLDLQSKFESETDMQLLKDNAYILGKSIDSSNIQEHESFSLRRDAPSQTYIIYTGALIDSGAHIDITGGPIDDIGMSDTHVYRRIFTLDRRDTSHGARADIVRSSITEVVH